MSGAPRRWVVGRRDHVSHRCCGRGHSARLRDRRSSRRGRHGPVARAAHPGAGRRCALRRGAGDKHAVVAAARSVGVPFVPGAFADNPVGRLLEDPILQGGVETTHVAWRPYDGIGRRVRNGLNFVSAASACARPWEPRIVLTQPRRRCNPGTSTGMRSSPATERAGFTAGESSRRLRRPPQRWRSS